MTHVQNLHVLQVFVMKSYNTYPWDFGLFFWPLAGQMWRKIPLHADLIERGLIEYLSSLRKNDIIRLIPELNKTEKSPKYGKQVGKFFTKLLNDNGISGKKSFHSLRHSFSDYFKKMNMHTDMFRQVFGHEIEHLAGRQYGDRFSPRQIYDELISKIDFDS